MTASTATTLAHTGFQSVHELGLAGALTVAPAVVLVLTVVAWGRRGDARDNPPPDDGQSEGPPPDARGTRQR